MDKKTRVQKSQITSTGPHNLKVMGMEYKPTSKLRQGPEASASPSVHCRLWLVCPQHTRLFTVPASAYTSVFNDHVCGLSHLIHTFLTMVNQNLRFYLLVILASLVVDFQAFFIILLFNVTILCSTLTVQLCTTDSAILSGRKGRVSECRDPQGQAVGFQSSRNSDIPNE